MKKHFLLFGAALTIIGAAQAQIPNNDFEEWTTTSADALNNWQLQVGHVTKVTDKHSGSLAVKLQGDTSNGNEEPGVVLYGNSEDGTYFWDGVPLAAKPDSLISWLKYDIAAGDTAMVLLITKKNHAELSHEWFKITGSSNTYKRHAFKINYTVSGQTPDSVILGFISTNFMNEVNAASWLMVDDVSFAGTALNVPNPGFEDWKVLSHNYLNKWYDGYNVRDLLFGRQPNMSRTTDKATGNYALLLQNIIQNGDTSWGYTRTGGPDQWSGPTFPVSGKKDTLYGLYKWMPQNLDTFEISASFYKMGSMVGYANWVNGEAKSTWTIFKIPVNYFGMDIPDSASISINSARNKAKGASKLYLDNINFNQVYNISSRNFTSTGFRVWPNPASDRLQVELTSATDAFRIEIFNSQGQQVLNEKISAGENTLDISRLSPGIYTAKREGYMAATRFVKK
ncbi:MAG: T9SS type A sorting domain-containing protein [Bacteroidetes bacterium]|nr:T9SS type A sorting domain-containing protein [Bacteroidota bacterium]